MRNFIVRFWLGCLIVTAMRGTYAHAEPRRICPPASEYYAEKIQQERISDAASWDHVILYWEEKGVDAVLASPNATRTLGRIYERKYRSEKLHKRIYKHAERLRKGKKNLKRAKGLPDKPPKRLLRLTAYDMRCTYAPEKYDAKAVKEREAQAKAKADAQERARQEKQKIFSEIDRLVEAGNKAAADEKMRQIYPEYMRAHDAALKTRGQSCLPAAGPTATKAEILEQYHLYNQIGEYSGRSNVETYGKESEIFRRVKGLDSAYANQLVSRFGPDAMLEGSRIVFSLSKCTGYFDNSCQILSENGTSFRRLINYYNRVEQGDRTPLDRSTIPLLEAKDKGILKEYPDDDSEIWKESFLGACSNQHHSRTLEAYVEDVSAYAWKRPTEPAYHCQLAYDYGSKQLQNASRRLSDESVGWLLNFEKNKGKSCDIWPSEITPPNLPPPPAEPAEKAYTLEQGLQDIQKEIADAPRVMRCTTNSSGIETCVWSKN